MICGDHVTYGDYVICGDHGICEGKVVPYTGGLQRGCRAACLTFMAGLLLGRAERLASPGVSTGHTGQVLDRCWTGAGETSSDPQQSVSLRLKIPLNANVT